MQSPALPPNEKERLQAVRAYRILDTPPEPDFDDLVALASEICEVPIALVTLMDEERQWFKATTGTEVRELPRSISFCGHAILQDHVFVVEDALEDPRFADNPLVSAPPNVRFYAGAQLKTDAGFKLGTLCVIDRVARRLSDFQSRALVILSKQVVAQLELRARIFALARLQQQKEELTSLVVHDLKSPLSSVATNAHYLAGASELTEKRRAAASDIESAAESMGRMVMNILDISQSEAGGLTPSLTEVRVGELLEEVAHAAAARAQQDGLGIEVSSVPATLPLRADRDLLRRVLENLLDNSIKYARTGTVIQLDAREVVDGVEIRVRDHGPGIPEAFKTRIFEKYFQLDRDAGSHRRVSRGLGLAFCQLAVEAHGGKIWVEDSEPHGSCFCVHLPR
jgi:signal transduction histidine kinase